MGWKITKCNKIIERCKNKNIKRKTNVAITKKKNNLEKVKYKRAVGFDEKQLPRYAIVRYLYQPGEYEGGRQRATDPIWSVTKHRLSRRMVKTGQPVLYWLYPKPPNRSFVREELQIV